MVGTGRFELPTPRTPSECSTRLSHVPTRKDSTGATVAIRQLVSLQRRGSPHKFTLQLRQRALGNCKNLTAARGENGSASAGPGLGGKKPAFASGAAAVSGG